MMAELKQKVDRKESDEPRKVPAPEREARLASQKMRLSGMDIRGPNEPGHTLIDNVAQQREDELFRYIELEQCVSRQDETRATKINKAKALMSTDLQMRQAICRRNLAYDQMEIIPWSDSEEWTNFLFSLPQREAPAGWSKVSMDQVLMADKQMYVMAAEECRAGICKLVGMGTYPMVQAMQALTTSVETG